MYQRGVYRAFDPTFLPKEKFGLPADGIRSEYTYKRGMFGFVTGCVSVRIQLSNGEWLDVTPTMTKADHKGFPADVVFRFNRVPGFAESEQKLD